MGGARPWPVKGRKSNGLNGVSKCERNEAIKAKCL